MSNIVYLEPREEFDVFIIGHASSGAVVYDENALVEHYKKVGIESGMSDEAAYEYALDYFIYNIEPITFGLVEGYPIFVKKLNDEDN